MYTIRKAQVNKNFNNPSSELYEIYGMQNMKTPEYEVVYAHWTITKILYLLFRISSDCCHVHGSSISNRNSTTLRLSPCIWLPLSRNMHNYATGAPFTKKSHGETKRTFLLLNAVPVAHVTTNKLQKVNVKYKSQFWTQLKYKHTNTIGRVYIYIYI